jgi:hypothetical protein
MYVLRKSLLFACLVVPAAGFTPRVRAQQTSIPAEPAAMTTPMTPEQTALLHAARKDFGSRDYKSALTKMETLHRQRPEDKMLAAGTGETAINAGDYDLAASILKPLALQGDWHAHTFLARLYAEQHDTAARDAELQTLAAMQAATTDPQFAGLTQILLERIPLKAGFLDLYYSLKPWSRYNIHAMARVYDSDGRQTYRITLESADFDQPNWQKQHPDLAAKGMRMFSLDGYSEPQRNANGTATQTHATFGFLDGKPSYDDMKGRMVAIANKTSTPVSSLTNPMSTPR